MTPSTYPAKGYAAFGQTSPLAPFSFDRRRPGPHDVQIEILYCGVCHSDLHTLRVAPSLDLAAAAPLLCAGITTYSPLRHCR